MSNAYDLCPGGTGKKIKFCPCCQDITAELEKIDRMLEGEQFQACLTYCEGLDKLHPNRPSVMATLAEMQIRLEKPEAAATVKRFCDQFPQNGVAWSLAALERLRHDDWQAAMQAVEKAITSTQLPMELVEAIRTLALSLFMADKPMAAYAHISLAAQLAPDDQHTQDLYMQVVARSPLPMREMQAFQPAPAGAPWQAEYDAAIDRGRQGQWLDSVAKLAALVAKSPDAAVAWRSLGFARGWTGDEPGAAEALRKYVALSSDLEQGVEAEVLAQALHDRDEVDILRYEFPIKDFDALLAKLSGDHRAVSRPVDPQQWIETGETPPQAYYEWLDKPRLATAADFSYEKAPRRLADLQLFGKRTDREALAAFTAVKTPATDLAKAEFAKTGGETLGPQSGESVITKVMAIPDVLVGSLRLPADLPPAEIRAAASRAHREAITQFWPDRPSQQCGGRSPRQAAKDMPVQVLAGIKALELREEDDSIDYNALRTSLGLAAEQPAKVTETVADLSLLALLRVDLAALSDDELVLAYDRASHSNLIRLVRRSMLEILRRPSLEKEFDKKSLYRALIRLTPDPEEATGWINKGRELSAGSDPELAAWDMAELSIRLTAGDAVGFERLFRKLESGYPHLPEVRNALFRFAMQAGLIRPGAMPGVPGTRVPGGAPLGAMPAAAAAAPAAGKLWTPDQPQAAPAEGAAKKPAIWMPGMQ